MSDPAQALEECVPATFRLALMRQRCPELSRELTTARNQLAQAILVYDDAEDRVQAEIAAGINPRHHSMHEAAAVNTAMIAHSQALANLLRGEKS